ncbi:MAG: glycosyltransferase family 2 protein [Actinobacteria bacterium]|nr:glycosyltransferase family 2 protein [Actinomycetota bacterium]
MILSIIIPVFNEEETIEQTLDKVFSVKLPSYKKEVIVVDDGSDDNSKFKVQSSKFFKHIKYINHKKNIGKGAAIRTGLKHATGDYVIIQDADLEYNPKFYTTLLEPVLNSKAQVVYGSRLMVYPLKFWGEDKTVLPLHLLANHFLTMLTNLLYGSNVTDMETGYKLFKKEVLKDININSKKFDFEAEITAKILKNKIPIIEIPISVKPRTYKEGKKIGWKDGISAIWTLLKYRFID